MFQNWIERLGPIGSALVAAALFMAGLVIILYPQTLVWFTGLGLMLASVAVLAAAFAPQQSSGSRQQRSRFSA